jgi:hypothetical protein
LQRSRPFKGCRTADDDDSIAWWRQALVHHLPSHFMDLDQKGPQIKNVNYRYVWKLSLETTRKATFYALNYTSAFTLRDLLFSQQRRCRVQSTGKFSGVAW